MGAEVKTGHIKGEGTVYYLHKDAMFRGKEETIYILVLEETCPCLFSCLTLWVNDLGLNFNNCP